jgi:hypothetical protein
MTIHEVLAAAAVCSAAGASCADTVVIPQAAASTGGSGAYSTLLNSQARSYQLVIGTAELAGRLPVGATITGLSWRLASWQSFASWPAGSATFSAFDIYLAQSTVPPGSLSLSDPMSNVGPDVVMVRSGPAVFAPQYFPGGAVSPNFNPFCQTIEFTSAYTYQGGDLLLMVRHTGNNAGNGNLDWVASQHGQAGAQGISASGYTTNTGWGGGGNGGAIVVRFTFTPPGAVCYANCDGSTIAPMLNVLDFNCFLNKFAAGDPYANCDGSTTAPVLNVLDFNCFLNKFAAGCSAP